MDPVNNIDDRLKYLEQTQLAWFYLNAAMASIYVAPKERTAEWVAKFETLTAGYYGRVDVMAHLTGASIARALARLAERFCEDGARRLKALDVQQRADPES